MKNQAATLPMQEDRLAWKVKNVDIKINKINAGKSDVVLERIYTCWANIKKNNIAVGMLYESFRSLG